MYTQTIAPTNGALTVEIPREMVGHRVEIIINDLEAKPLRRFKNGEELRAFFNATSVDTRGFKFNRDEANER